MATTAWIRHPRYSLLILVTLMTTFYLLFIARDRQITSFHAQLQDNSLENRVQRSHTIYNKMLDQRQGLVKKFGPNPKDIALYVVVSSSFVNVSVLTGCPSFPPDKSPWPPYTICKLYFIRTPLLYI